MSTPAPQSFDTPDLLLVGPVRHKRLRPASNAFSYGVYTLRLPLRARAGRQARGSQRDSRLFATNRFGLLSFYDSDHGADGQTALQWIESMLHENGIHDATGEIFLHTFPRVLGYVFNPVSFWFCRDRSGALRAVLCEVNNTFGETHCYLVHHDDNRPIGPDAWLEGRKAFHVSPFLPIEGGYRFRFRLDDEYAHVDVNYHDADGLMLATSVGGRREALDDRTVLRRFLGNPTMTLAVIVRIHWQALHLWRKRARFYRKPAPPPEFVTR
jgi:DUF1365 family protein